MKQLTILIILITIQVWTVEAVYSKDQNQSGKTATAQYQCPNHPEIIASWPAKCPKCGANLARRPQPGQMMSNRSRAMEMRRRIMMNTAINVFDPEAILCAKRPLNLTQGQIEQLRVISKAARQCAREVLTDRQRRQLSSLRNLPNYPKTMKQMNRWMTQKTSSPSNMMMGKIMQQTKAKDPKNAADPPSKAPDPPSKMSDPPAEGRINSGIREFGSRTPQDQLRDNLRDSLRDRYRDEYRDRLRDRYRDQYRDAYRDGLRDNLDGTQGFGDEGFGNNEGFDDDEGFGDEGFGNNEGFDNDGGFGDEGFGNNEGFDNDEGFGDEGFGNNEGFDDDGFGNDEGFGGDEGRR